LLAQFGIVAHEGCGCVDFARQMDAWGPEGCRQRKEQIVNRLVEQAQKRAGLAWLPGKARLAAWLVDLAIRRCEERERMLVVPPTTYITTARLEMDTVALAGRLPEDVDAVVAIARSGLLPGTLIACLRHLPLWATQGGMANGEKRLTPVGGGIRLTGEHEPPISPQPKHVALVDDTAWSGHSMRTWLPVVRHQWPEARVTRAVVYAHPNSFPWVDVALARYEGTHYLEWNLFNTGYADSMATDLDGILCNPRTGLPIQTPRRRPVLAVITGRPQEARADTIAWLTKHGIRYRELVLGPWQTWAELPDAETIGRWKAGEILRVGAQLYVESEPAQAVVIRRETGRQVLCPDMGGLLP
jgi:hypoxanthine phosphoribosyltransferase